MTLPKGWTKAKLGEFTLERVEQGEPGAAPVPYIDIGSIDRDVKRVGPTEKVTGANAPTRARQWVKPGDVLVSLTRPNLNAVAMVPPELDGAVASTAFDVLRPGGVLAEWVFNRVRSPVFVSDVCGGVQGVVYPAIRPADVRRHDLPIPPVQEQRRIVDAIDSYLTRVDDAVASFERVQTKLKAYRASMLKAAVEGRLVPTEASLARTEKRDYESAEVLLARILKERRHRWEEAELARLMAAGKTPKDDKWKGKYEEPVAPDTSALPELPEGWCWTSLGQAFTVTVGATPSRSVPRYWDGDIPWVSSGEVSFCRITDTKERITSAGLHASSTRMNPRGSVLLGMIGEGRTRGQAAILDIDACGNQNAAAIWVSQTEVPPEYVYHYLVGQYETTRRRGSGNNQPALNKARVEAIPLPLPPVDEQRRIVERLERDESTIGNSEATVEREWKRIHRLRQAILKWAFEGKLIDQDPNDEPAERLLARIRAERAVADPKNNGRGRQARGAA